MPMPGIIPGNIPERRNPMAKRGQTPRLTYRTIMENTRSDYDMEQLRVRTAKYWLGLDQIGPNILTKKTTHNPVAHTKASIRDTTLAFIQKHHKKGRAGRVVVYTA
jgi:hypothetical protein